jgi:hypothetical protein
MPMHFAPGALRGLKVGVDLRPKRGIDGRALLNLSYLSLGATYGDRHDAPDAWSGALTLHLIRDPIRPYSLSVDFAVGDGGTGRGSTAVEVEDQIAGIAVGWNGEGIFGVLVPWFGARVQRRSIEVAGGPEQPYQTGFGLSAGTELRLSAVLPQLGRLGGLSLHAAGDLLNIREGAGSDRATRFTFSFGVSYVLSIRVFPERGIIPPPKQMVQ